MIRIRPLITIFRTQWCSFYSTQDPDKLGKRTFFNNQGKQKKPLVEKKQVIFQSKVPEQKDTVELQERQEESYQPLKRGQPNVQTLGVMNLFLKDKPKEQSLKEQEDLKMLKQKYITLKNLPDSHKKFLNLLQLNSLMVNLDDTLQNFNDYSSKFPFNQQINDLTLTNLVITNNFQNVWQFLINQKKYLNKMDQNNFKKVYEMIFKSKLLPYEKSDYLIQYFDLLDKSDIKISTFDLSYFSQIFTEEYYQQYSKNYKLNFQCFSKYLANFAENKKDKSKHFLVINGFHSKNISNTFFTDYIQDRFTTIQRQQI